MSAAEAVEELKPSRAPGAWTLYSEERPAAAGVYEWRVQSKAVPGAVLIVAAHMRWRGAGYENVLSPVFDYWDGYRVHVLSSVEWRETDSHQDLKKHERKVIAVEGLEPGPCIYCGKLPRLEAHQYSAGGITVCADPWNLNSWRFICCSWGSSPMLSDPREIERMRQAAIQRVREAASHV